ncbi:MAG: thioredoxin family protein [Desulfuromonas sp.]|nr:thioredoxin family protein [Desulfuromonas sp.]
MKRTLSMLVFGLTLMFIQQAQAAENIWHVDFDLAKKIAQQENKSIFANFSGSDWCHWCKKLDKDILKTEEFQTYAKDNLVLLLVDFPKRTKQTKRQIEHNRALANEFNVRGFPTVILLKANGTLISVTGYRYGGPKAYVEHIEKLIKD